MALKKVKEIYFKNGIGLPVYVMMNGETKSPYQMGNTIVYATPKEFADINKNLKVAQEDKPKKKWYQIFKK